MEVLLEHLDGDENMGLELGRDVCAADINWGLISIQTAVRLLRENIYKKKLNAQEI